MYRVNCVEAVGFFFYVYLLASKCTIKTYHHYELRFVYVDMHVTALICTMEL